MWKGQDGVDVEANIVAESEIEEVLLGVQATLHQKLLPPIVRHLQWHCFDKDRAHSKQHCRNWSYDIPPVLASILWHSAIWCATFL